VEIVCFSQHRDKAPGEREREKWGEQTQGGDTSTSTQNEEPLPPTEDIVRHIWLQTLVPHSSESLDNADLKLLAPLLPSVDPPTIAGILLECEGDMLKAAAICTFHRKNTG
jgi:hypothetical protein